MIWEGMVSQWSVILDECYPIRLHGCCFYLFLLYGFKFLVTGMWIMRYAILGLFSCFLFPLSFLVSRSSQRRRLGVLVLVLFWFCSNYLLGRFVSVFSSNDRFIIFQSVTGVSECSSMCIVGFTHVADGFLMLA